MLLPPIAESTRPPLVVGYPFEGGVEALLPDGTRERLTAPEMLDIEITPIITIGAPVITFPPGAPRMIPYAPPPAPPAPTPPYVPEPEPPYVPPEPEPPYVPPAPEPPPVVPEVPMIDILAQPSLNLPRQINVGDAWAGSVSLPTFGTVPYFVEAHLVMVDPSGYQYTGGQGSRTLSPRETLQVPINFDTAGLPAGNYSLFLMVYNQVGHLVAQFPMGFLSMIEAPVPVPEVKYRIGEIRARPLVGGGIRQPDISRPFSEGETVTLEARPEEGYQFTGWQLDGAPWRSDNPLTFTMHWTTMAPEVKHSIAAVFVPVPAEPEVVPEEFFEYPWAPYQP